MFTFQERKHSEDENHLILDYQYPSITFSNSATLIVFYVFNIYFSKKQVLANSCLVINADVYSGRRNLCVSGYVSGYVRGHWSSTHTVITGKNIWGCMTSPKASVKVMHFNLLGHYDYFSVAVLLCLPHQAKQGHISTSQTLVNVLVWERPKWTTLQ